MALNATGKVLDFLEKKDNFDVTEVMADAGRGLLHAPVKGDEESTLD